jgi:hypothetical protein
VFFAAEPVVAEDLEFHSQTTLGARLYDFESPFDEDITSFFDQYRDVRDKDADVPWFLDFFHNDLGLVREDGTYLVRFERWSPNWRNQRGVLDIDWKGLDVEVNYQLYQKNDLRVFPMGTGGALPTLGSVYNPETTVGNPLGFGERFYNRRAGIDGEARLRPEAFGMSIPWLKEVRLHSGYENRRGRDQARYLLESNVAGLGALPQTERFRGIRIKQDQDVARVGGGFILQPTETSSAVFDFTYEALRENAPVVTIGGVAAGDPGIPGGLPPETAARALFFVPDTDRFTGSVATSARVGSANLHAGMFVTHLTQTNRRAPLQDLLGIGDTSLTTWSADGSFDVPIGKAFSVDGYAKTVWRRNNTDQDTFAKIASDGVQVNSFMRRRREITAGLEVSSRPIRGTTIAVGARTRYVDRSLRFGSSPGAILEEFNLIEEKNESYTLYLRSSARLARTLQLSGELGYEYAPKVAFPRDLQESFYFKGRASYTITHPIPITLSSYGKFLTGDNDEIELQGVTPERSKQKKFDNERASYGVTLTAMPCKGTSLYASFAHSWDEQKFSYLRSNLPRNFGPAGLAFYVDSEPRYRGKTESLMVGGNFPIVRNLFGEVSSSVMWVRAYFSDSSLTSGVLEGSSEIRDRIVSIEGRIRYEVNPSFRVQLGYRFDDFHDGSDLELLGLDTQQHIYTISFTYQIPNP